MAGIKTINMWPVSCRTNVAGIHSGALPNYLHRNPLEAHQVSAPEPSKTSSGTCTWIFRNLTEYLHWNPMETDYLHRNPQELHQVWTGTVRNLTRYLHRNPPEPHPVSAPSRTSTSICTRTLRNPPEPCPEPGVEAAPDRTRANLG